MIRTVDGRVYKSVSVYDMHKRNRKSNLISRIVGDLRVVELKEIFNCWLQYLTSFYSLAKVNLIYLLRHLILNFQ